jgi:hypothetical protein
VNRACDEGEVVRKVKVLLVAVLLFACATPPSPLPSPRKTIPDLYLEANKQHMAPAEKWMKGISDTSKCYRLVETDPKAVQPCLDQAPPPASFLPNDRQKDETISNYLERKQDEWGERDCFYKGLIGRSVHRRESAYRGSM